MALAFTIQAELWNVFIGLPWPLQAEMRTPVLNLYTLSHRENDRDVSAYSRRRCLITRALHVCYLTRSKKNSGIDAQLMRLACVLQRISIGTHSDVTVVLGMRQSIVTVQVLSQPYYNCVKPCQRAISQYNQRCLLHYDTGQNNVVRVYNSTGISWTNNSNIEPANIFLKIILEKLTYVKTLNHLHHSPLNASTNLDQPLLWVDELRLKTKRNNRKYCLWEQVLFWGNLSFANLYLRFHLFIKW